MATTAAYQVTFSVLGEEAEALLRRRVAVARDAAGGAVDKHGGLGECLVAASISPYGAGPGEDTDYDGVYGLSREELYHWHARRVAVLTDTDADLFLLRPSPTSMRSRYCWSSCRLSPNPSR
ncbi:homocysteine S-methyltransferase family protein [Corynebacterium marquesiae]|uniref:homocysteine S-methyltransferase family protein n=1 Tax=Corynebacterium marquesiae TaxID=2913503 RepID=UPI0040421DDB